MKYYLLVKSCFFYICTYNSIEIYITYNIFNSYFQLHTTGTSKTLTFTKRKVINQCFVEAFGKKFLAYFAR